MKKNKVIFGLIILILMATIIACFFTTSKGYSEEVDGLKWYYEVVDGEAVKVRVIGGLSYNTQEIDGKTVTKVSSYTSNGWKELEKLVIPDTLGGYPVTSIAGYVGYMNWSTNGINTWFEVGSIKEVVLPEGLKSIGEHAFEGFTALEKVNIPNSLESIEYYAFRKTNVKEFKIKDIDINVKSNAFLDSALESVEISGIESFTGIFNGCSINKVVIGEGVKTLNASFSCIPEADVQVSSDIERINRTAFRDATDAYIDRVEEEVVVYNGSGRTWFHFKNLEKIETNVPEGIKVINTDTNEEFTTTKATTGSNFSFKIEPQEGYTFDDYVVYLESYGTYYDDPKIIEKLDVSFGETYTIENVTRAKKIHVRAKKYGLDLALRQYIYSLNYEKLTSREPVLEVNGDEQAKYLHSKSFIYPRVGDKIRYAVRVYNEGTVAGTANKITYYIPEGLDFDTTSEANSQYGWVKSEDGRTATTEYLSDKTIEGCTITNDFKNEEIFIDLVLNIEPTNEVVRLVTMAEITEDSGEDIDSTPGNIELPISNDYKKEESEISNSKSYIAGDEDDYDFENVASTNNIAQPYSLVIKKIDGFDSQLLNGSTFELLDADKNVIRTGVTANGGVLDFGTVYAYGEDKTTYYIRETNTPEGYNNHLKYLIQVDVVSQVSATTEVTAKFEIDIKDIDIDTSKYKTIAISSKEDLMAIQSNTEDKYVLTQDIDLGEEWTPLNVQNVKLDGQNHKITGLKLEGTDETIKTWGLFGTYSGIIENLTLEGVNINITKFDAEESTDVVDGVGGFIGYSDGVILKNCRVTGAIGDSLRNIGGLVGHTKSGSILVTRDCVNEANIHFTKSSNAGGIVGCALGPVKSYNDTNKGYVVGSAYNVGGIVGYARQDGYTTTQVLANYEESTKIATLAIKNEAISGKYKFRISKTDEFGNKLDGAKFQILDRNKQVIPGYESVEATDGILNYEETRIDCIGNDVYYIKEVEAPEGYLAIEDNYVKVVITKKWNKENGRYYIETSYKVLNNEEFENEVSEEYNTSTAKTGLTNDNYVNDKVQWNINEVDIENATNDYSVIGSDGNRATIVGGILGNSQGRALISGSVNKKSVVSSSTTPRAAGIVGTIEKYNDSDEANIINCTNEASVNTSGPNSSNGLNGNNAGILAYSRIDISIDGCDNKGNVSGVTNEAGVLGSGVGNIEISNCNNTAQISGSRTSSGIFAENFYINGSAVDNGNTIIDNCTNSGNITGGNGHGSGIYGVGDPYDFTVTNCSVSGNINITGSCASGIAIMASSENVTIEDCKLEGVTIATTGSNSGSTKHASGILALAMTDTFINLSPEQRGREQKNDIVIKNCEVDNATIFGENAAGIESHGGYGYNRVINNNISDCHLKNTHINAQSGRYGHAGGIFGSGYCLKNINIDSCIVEDSEVNGGYNTSGIMACSGYNGSAQLLFVNVNNCQVLGTEIHSSANAGGVIGDCNFDTSGSYRGSLEVSNARVYDCEITGAINTAGVLNSAFSNCYYDATINDCIVEKTNITGGSNTYSNTSGIVGALNTMGDYVARINRCKVIDCDISSSGTAQTSGILGFNWGKTNVYDCEVSGTSIICASASGSVVTGLVGTLYGTSGTNEIKGCSVNNCSISGAGTHVAGMYSGYSGGSISFENCTVDTTSIASTRTTLTSSSAYGNTSTGGICSGGYDTDTFKNCTVKNSSISSKSGTTGGMIGSAYKASFNGCITQNTIINSEGETCGTGGLIGTVSGSGGEVSLNNCSVTDNCEITAKGYSTGGMVGYTNKINNLKNCTAQDLTITAGGNNRQGTYNYGSIGGIIGDANGTLEGDIEGITVKNVSLSTTSDNVGGIIGINLSSGTKKIKDCDIENLTIESSNTYGISGNGYGSGRLIAGLMGMTYCSMEFENTTVKNIDIEVQSGYTNSIHMGGLFAYAGRNVTINNDSTISDINIVNGTTGITGGLIGFTFNTVSMTQFENYNNISVSSNGYTGAISGLHFAKITIDGLSGKNITVQGKEEVGGLIGVASIGETSNVSNINLEDLTVTGERKVGGLLGNVIGTVETSLDNITINKLNVSNTYTEAENYTNTGGLIGYALKPTLNDITINGLNVSSSVPEYNSNGTAMGICTGGLVGVTASYTSYGTTTTETPIAKFNNITISNMENSDANNVITSKSQYTGGLIGYTDNLETSGQVRIENTNISHTQTDYEINNDKNYGNMGGIVGFANNYSSAQNITLSNIEITGGNYIGGITSKSGTLISLNNNTINNLKIEGYGTVGGLVGFIYSNSTNGPITDNVTISNNTLKNITITTQGENSRAGGLIGIVTHPVISNVEMQNIDVSITDGNSTDVGGLIGAVTKVSSLASDTTVEAVAELTDITVSSTGTNTNSVSVANGIAGGLVGYADKIQTTGDIEVSNMNLIQGGNSSNYPGVGGIVGTVQKYPTISNITLNNVEMTGTKYAGGITGVVYQETSNISDITLNNVKVSATNLESGYVESQTGGLIGLIASANIQNITADGIEVTNGRGNAGGLVGTVTNSYINNGNIAVSDIVNVKDSTLKNIKVTGTNTGYYNTNVGGLIGFAKAPVISNITLTNIDINALVSTNGNAGGLIAVMNSGSTPAQFSDITINTEGTARNKVTGMNYANMLAGVGQLTTSNINISNINATGKVAGAIGVATSGSTVKDITVNNANITGLSGGQFAAGIVAETSGSSVESCTVNNSTITTTSVGFVGGIVGLYSADSLGPNGKVLSCNANNVNITATGGQQVGGIIGLTNGGIEESNVTGGSIATTNISHVGGIAGMAANTTGETKNCNVTNNTSIKSTTVGAVLGGIAGLSNQTISGCKVSSATIENAGCILGGIAGYMTLNSNTANYKIDNCNVENSTLTATRRNQNGYEYVGGIAGISNSPITNSNVTGSTITAEGSNVGGIAGMLSNTNSTVATAVKLSNCTVTSTTIEGKLNYVGGIAGFSNNTIENSIITDSEVKGTGETSSGIGGILGHGSNVTGLDANIYNSKVICTNVTGVNQVGGISGGAVNTIEGCYVGGKEGATYTEDEPAITITGNNSVGGIIGDAGIINSDSQVMITLKDNTIQNTKVDRIAREKLTGESDDEHKMIGTHNSFGTIIVSGEEVPYTGTQVETISGNTVTNVTLNERTE